LRIKTFIKTFILFGEIMIKFKLFGALVFLSMLSLAQAPAFAVEGRQTTAPPWSAACMTDHGPSDCGEPMWVYGDPEQHARGQSHFEIR
jgi:hypothetical protein